MTSRKMEENVTKLFREGLPSIKHLTEELFQNTTLEQDDWVAEIPKQGAQELSEEEETLRIYLDKLKKENFTLRTRITAWQTTLETKLEEFREADLKLEELYNEIWSEREKFCSKLEEFNDEYGILSKWWEMQIRFVSELENPGGESPDGRTCVQEIEKLEKEIADLKSEIEELQVKKRGAEVQSTGEGDSISARNESKTDDAEQEVKKAKFSEAGEENKSGKTGEDPASDLYSVVDLEKVKIAKRRRRNNFLCREKKLQKPKR